MPLSVVQTLPFGVGTASSGPYTSPTLSTTTGNTLVVGWGNGSGFTVSSVKTAAGASFTALTPQTNGTAILQLFYLPNITGNASEAITVTLSSNASTNTPVGFIWELSGVLHASPLDVNTGATGTTATTITTPSFTTLEPAEIIVCMTRNNNISETAGNWTGNAGYTVDSSGFPSTGTAIDFCGAQHLITSSIQTGVTASMTSALAGTFIAIAAASFYAAVEISALTFSPSESTIVATWTTSASTDSNLSAGGKAAIDNGVAANSTSHQCIVTGLIPNTAYSCVVTSGGFSSTPQTVTTLPAQTRIPITSSSLALMGSATNGGDSFTFFVSNDNNTYCIENDGYGWVKSTPNSGANMQIGVLTNEVIPVGTLTNILSAYGTVNDNTGTDGPGGNAMNNKAFDIMSMAGNLYVTCARQLDPGTYMGNVFYQDQFANIIMSEDHGATWNNFTATGTFNANGSPVSAGTFQFDNANIGIVNFVRYAVDDGTLGYLTAGNRIDGADGWVYMHYRTYPTGTLNGSAEYMCRIPRIQLAAQSSTSFQYWVGPTSPAPSDFVNDSNWSTSATGATNIYSTTYQTSWADMCFIPALNIYLWLQWYRVGGNTVDNTGDSVWTLLSGPTPCGPWTVFYNNAATPWNPSGYSRPAVMHRTAATNTRTTNALIEVISSGNFTSPYQAYYVPHAWSLILNPIPMNQYFTSNFATVENPLSDGGIFQTTFGTSALKVASAGICEATVSATGCQAIYVGQAFPADQYAEIVIGANFTDAVLSCSVRNSPNVHTCYQLGGIQSGASQFVIQVVQAGTATTTYTIPMSTFPAVGDVWRIEAQGSNILVYQNGILLTVQPDSTITGGGYAGCGVYAPGSITQASVGNFACGAYSTVTPLSIVTIANGAQGASSVSSVPTNAFNLTAGNAVVAFVRHTTALAATPITDTAGNTYTPVGTSYTSSVDSTHTQFYLCASALGNAANIVTMHLSTAETFDNVVAWQIAGSGGGLVFDGTANNVLTSAGTTLTSASFNTAYQNEIVLVFGKPDAAALATALGNYVTGGAASVNAGLEHQIFSGTQTSQTATMAQASNTGTILVAAFGLNSSGLLVSNGLGTLLSGGS